MYEANSQEHCLPAGSSRISDTVHPRNSNNYAKEHISLVSQMLRKEPLLRNDFIEASCWILHNEWPLTLTMSCW